MLVKSNGAEERKIINALVSEDEELRRQHEIFVAEMAFKQELINARQAEELTQKDISRRSGLSQQAVSRMEKGQGGTIETVLRYLVSMGYTLTLRKN